MESLACIDMASKGQGRGVAVSQGAFDALVAENMEEFGMDAEEAAEDAVRALSLQGADLRGKARVCPANPAQSSRILCWGPVRRQGIAVEDSGPCTACSFVMGGAQVSTRQLRRRELLLCPWTTWSPPSDPLQQTEM